MTYLTDNDLKKYGKTFSLSKRAIALINHQKASWPLAASNYASLRQIQTRTFDFGHFRIDCQFNPGRILSTAANTDAGFIQQRACFLCEPHRPPQQAGIHFGDDYIILCNPFPIFPYHLTIPLLRHEPQLIAGHMQSFLHLTRELQEFVVFYNGHFQAGIRDVLPIEDELEELLASHADTLLDSDDIKIVAVENYLRRFLFFRSSHPENLEKWITAAVTGLTNTGINEEPMINILGWFTHGAWQVVMFPRSARRPREYFADDFERIMVSPAAVELGGLVILPREEDFYKVTAEDLASIFGQVSIQKNEFDKLKERLIQML
jgi:hypothetical protein